MDYKKKYENALPYIKNLVEHNVISIESAGKYFPELKENKDERISKELVACNDNEREYDNWYCPNCEEEIGIKEPISKTFPRVNEFDVGNSYRR